LALLTPNVFGQAFNTTGTTTVSVAVAAEASIRIDTPTTTLSTTGTIFNDYTGTTNFTYKVRTGKASGNGNIQLLVGPDFSPTGGPSVGTPPSPGDALSYNCTVSSPGTACTGPLSASTTTATSVATFGANARSTKNGNSGSVGWILTNDPVYETGTYSATVTFTISAT
jgi:hypothetical protein